MMNPTVVLVHGAFADGSSWGSVIERLQRRGYMAVAVANPLRGVSSDSAYLVSFLRQIDGPVLLVGHSYAGALFTDTPNVVGLVYVAAFAPDLDEQLGDVASGSEDSTLMTALVQREYPTEDAGTALEIRVDPAKFADVFAADVPPERAAVMAAIQRPVAAAAFSDACGPPAWKTLPAWAVVATEDRAAGTDVVRAMAVRAGAAITEVESSHVVMISQPDAVTDVIVSAARSVAASDRSAG